MAPTHCWRWYIAEPMAEMHDTLVMPGVSILIQPPALRTGSGHEFSTTPERKPRGVSIQCIGVQIVLDERDRHSVAE